MSLIDVLLLRLTGSYEFRILIAADGVPRSNGHFLKMDTTF